MSMLAGPRRKQKVINLRAKNNAWSNDNNKFGQRMLEKMGWSSGKGLGANEDGIVEHVVAKYKNDDNGLGYVDKNDQWTKHEDDFNALLANLSQGDSAKEELHSGISLEVKSKKSKARIHYHKFTRGKDLSRYSEKDLANIFGKKSFKNKIENVEILKEDVNVTEHLFTEKGSMEDYFKGKLATFKNKAKTTLFNNIDSANNEETDYVFRGFSGTPENTTKQTDESERICSHPFSFYNSSANNADEITKSELTCNENIKIKKKKSKKVKKTPEDDLINTVGDDDLKKKKNRNKHLASYSVIELGTEEATESVVVLKQKEDSNQVVIGMEDYPLKKKKSKKRKKSVELEENTLAPEGINILKKKKKGKNRDMEC